MNDILREIKQQITFFSTKCLDFPLHVHEDIELVFVLEGSGTVYCDGQKYTLEKNSFFLAFPNQGHRYEDCKNGTYILLIMKPSCLLSNSLVFLKGHPTSAVWHFDNTTDDNSALLLKMALEEYEQNGYSTVIDAYLTVFFQKLLKHYTIEKSNVSSNTVLQILQYCSEHYKDDITVEDIANHLQISRSSVSRIFSTRLSISFCDHINSLRLRDAVYLLENNNYSITDISAIAGFPSIRTFNRLFLKEYGISPSAYRKQFLHNA